MAINNIQYDRTTVAGQSINSLTRACRSLTDSLANHIAVEAAKIDGDGTDPAHFQRMVDEGTFPTTADAKSSYDQLNSLLANIAGTPNDAMGQVADYHGQP